MYKITYIHKDETTENVLYQPGSREYSLSAGDLNLGAGVSGELSISIPQTNPAKDDFVCLTDEVIAYRDDKEIWRGRAMTRQHDFYLTGTLTCEGVLSYLYDTYYPPFEFEGSPAAFLEMVLQNHNSQVEERKKIRLGNITVEDNNDYINRSSIYYNRTLTVLTEKLINDSLGGYFRVRIEDGVKYLDYLESYGTTATQAITFGSNLLDIAQEIEYSDLATVILPLGAKLEDKDGNETDEYLTIADVNGGSIYYADEAAVEEYGWIVVSAEWEDVTEASNLLTKAKNYLAQVTSAVSSFEIKAVDLALLSDEYDAFNLGDYILIQSRPHGVNQYVELTEMKIDILNPENDTYTFGSDTASLTDSQRTSDRNVQTALASMAVKFTNLVATAITAEYLSAKYITADDIEALYVKADALDASVANIITLETSQLYAALADIGYLTADTIIADGVTATTLVSELASVTALLSGSIGTGTVQTIHLTADNVVIDDAIITDAMIVDLSADKITAGTIYTDLVTIQSNADDTSLWINGSVIQMSDASTVRVQIGKDASGVYNFYIWDANGELMWDALGVTADGLNDGIIVDKNIADDANINQSKIDMASVAERLNEDGSITVNASSVTVDDTTLDYKLTSITTTTNSSITSSVSEYYVSTSPTDLTGGSWSTETPTRADGTYIWVRTTYTYGDGGTSTTEPVCVSGFDGEDGTDGEDAITLIIDSSNGDSFKNSSISTTLTVTIIVGSTYIDNSAKMYAYFGTDASIVWETRGYGESAYTQLSSDDSRLSDNGFILTLTTGDVNTKLVCRCYLEIGEEEATYLTDENGNYLTDEDSNYLTI